MDDDLIAYLEKKIKTLEAERDHWKSNHDNQVKLKQEITRRPSRFVEMVNEIESLKEREQELIYAKNELQGELHRSNQALRDLHQHVDAVQSGQMQAEIESLKKQLAAAPHWVPVAEFKAAEDVEHAVVFCASLYNPQCDPIDSEAIRLAHHRRDGSWAFSRRFANAEVTHVLVGMSPPSSNEDPRGDGDLLPENERLDDLTRECMRDELAVSTSDIEATMRRRLMESFLGSEAEKRGATKYQLRGGEEWQCETGLGWAKIYEPNWMSSVTYRLAKGEQHAATD